MIISPQTPTKPRGESHEWTEYYSEEPRSSSKQTRGSTTSSPRLNATQKRHLPKLNCLPSKATTSTTGEEAHDYKNRATQSRMQCLTRWSDSWSSREAGASKNLLRSQTTSSKRQSSQQRIWQGRHMLSRRRVSENFRPFLAGRSPMPTLVASMNIRRMNYPRGRRRQAFSSDPLIAQNWMRTLRCSIATRLLQTEVPLRDFLPGKRRSRLQRSRLQTLTSEIPRTPSNKKKGLRGYDTRRTTTTSSFSLMIHLKPYGTSSTCCSSYSFV